MYLTGICQSNDDVGIACDVKVLTDNSSEKCSGVGFCLEFPQIIMKIIDDMHFHDQIQTD